MGLDWNSASIISCVCYSPAAGSWLQSVMMTQTVLWIRRGGARLLGCHCKTSEKKQSNPEKVSQRQEVFTTRLGLVWVLFCFIRSHAVVLFDRSSFSLAVPQGRCLSSRRNNQVGTTLEQFADVSSDSQIWTRAGLKPGRREENSHEWRRTTLIYWSGQPRSEECSKIRNSIKKHFHPRIDQVFCHHFKTWTQWNLKFAF